MEEGESWLVATFISMPILFVLGLWEAVAVKLLWSWFMVPLGLAALSYWHAYGIVLLVSLVTHTSTDADLKRRLLNSILLPVVSIVFGALVHAFM